MTPRILLLMALGLAGSAPALAQPSMDAFQQRRAAVLAEIPGRLLIVAARGEAKTLTETGHRQASDFFYLTGLEHALRGLLVLDGTTGESHLFVPPPEGAPIPGLGLAPGPETAARLQLDGVSLWDAFPAYIDARIATAPDLTLLVLGPRGYIQTDFPEAPEGLTPIYGTEAALRFALATRWPTAQVLVDEGIVRGARLIKSPSEVDAIRRASQSASAAVLASLQSLYPGQTQRAAEATIVATCLETGADGVAWWPWVMTGPNAAFPNTFGSFATYRHLDRIMQAGELARIDVGCETDHYTSDVGRTAPVSGIWTEGQREAWDLLIAAYRAGLQTVRDGVTPIDIRNAFQAEVRSRRGSLFTDLGRQAAAHLLTDEGMRYWQLHHLGLDPSEGADLEAPLRAGMVVAYEPIFTVEGLGFYLEDLLHITEDGYELLTPGLPYTADEIERAMQ